MAIPSETDANTDSVADEENDADAVQVSANNQTSRSLIPRLLTLLLLATIRFYQTVLSPLKGPSCRFTPTCSEYAVQVIRKEGPLRGTRRAIRRILRCHPWNPGGYDPP